MTLQGLRVGDPVVTAGALSLAQAVQVNVEGGCALPDPCDSGPCPPHSYCSDDWDSFSCRCHPGEQGPPRPLTPLNTPQTSPDIPWDTDTPVTPPSATPVSRDTLRLLRPPDIPQHSPTRPPTQPDTPQDADIPVTHL